MNLASGFSERETALTVPFIVAATGVAILATFSWRPLGKGFQRSLKFAAQANIHQMRSIGESVLQADIFRVNMMVRQDLKTIAPAPRRDNQHIWYGLCCRRRGLEYGFQ
ncbi:hypothetical protein [uncultured Roseibium sp.]|uniref:hypothetical protein n=1 Tax=uncultured Roseibium sp. TaxID=1936171 RepID=UPI003217C873